MIGEPWVDIDTDSNNDGVINNVDDPIEEKPPGRIVPYNGDDDNNNGTPDREEDKVVGENDLAQVNLSYDLNGYPGQSAPKIILEASEGGENIKVWAHPTKVVQIELPKTYIVGKEIIPSVIYVEGYRAGKAMLDMVLKTAEGEEMCRDKVRLTVVHLTLTQMKFDYSSGTSTALTATVLTDTSANWLANEFVGLYLNPDVNDNSDGVFYRITANTQTTITVTGGDMTSLADPGDKYSVVCDDDALCIRRNYTTDLVLPEWDTAASRNEPAAYIKGKTPTVWAKFAVSPASITSAKIRATSLDILGGLGEQFVPFANGGSPFVRFTTANSTGMSVKSSSVTWTWQYNKVNSGGPASLDVAVGLGHKSGPHTIYTILSRPGVDTDYLPPWDNYGDQRPWTEALDWSCTWADGESTVGGVCFEVMQHIYSDLGGCYDEYGMSYYTPDAWYACFMLTNFLDAIPEIGSVNCYDCGKSLAVFANVVGCRVCYKWSDPFGMVNCIRPIGRDWTNNPFGDPPIVDGDSYRTGFGNHAYIGIGPDIEAFIYDACLTVDGDEDPDDPPCTEMWIDGMQWFDYIDAVVDDYPPSQPGFAIDFGFPVH